MNSTMQKPSKEIEIEEAARLLKSFNFVHSALLFGSKARGITGRDIDICIIPSREISLKEIISRFCHALHYRYFHLPRIAGSHKKTDFRGRAGAFN